jgi:hypothetical protein
LYDDNPDDRLDIKSIHKSEMELLTIDKLPVTDAVRLARIDDLAFASIEARTESELRHLLRQIAEVANMEQESLDMLPG